MRCRVGSVPSIAGMQHVQVEKPPESEMSPRGQLRGRCFKKQINVTCCREGMTRNDDGRQLQMAYLSKLPKKEGATPKARGCRLSLNFVALACVGFLRFALLGPDSSEITEADDQRESWSQCFPISLDNPAV